MLKRLLEHVSWYTLGAFLTTLASFISFPLLARTFSVAEYGVLNLISVTMLLLVGFAKAGVQHSVVRFYGDANVSGPQRLTSYRSTVLYGMLFSGVIVTVLGIAIITLLPGGTWNHPRMQVLMLIAAAAVLVRTADSAFTNLLRAQERSTAYTIYQIVKKYLGLLGTVIALWWLAAGLVGYYLAMLMGEFAVLIGLAWFSFHGEAWRPRDFDPRLYRSMMTFGIPMVGYEVMGIVLNAGDRYVIGWLEGNESVGIYSAAYNLCEYVEAIFVVSVSQAIQPIYVNLWKTAGAAPTSEFLGKALHLYIAGGAIVVAGVSAVGPEMLTLLASSKYASGSAIIPLVMVGMMLRGAGVIVGAGMYLHLQPRSAMFLIAAVAVFNMLLNCLLIPHMGIQGAALATAVCCAMQVAGMYMLSSRWLRIEIPWSILARYTALGFGMYFLVGEARLDNEWLSLCAKIGIGLLLAAALSLLVDGEMRRLAGIALQRAGLRAMEIRS